MSDAASKPAIARSPYPRAELADWLFLVLGLGCLAAGPHSLGGDGVRRFEALATLLERGELSPVKYSLVGPLLSTPLWLIGRAFSAAPKVTAYFNLLLFVAGLFALHALLRRILSPAVSRKLLLLLVFASMFPNHQIHYYAEPLTALLFGIGAAAVVLGRGALGWPLVVLGVTNVPATLGGAALLAADEGVRKKRLRYALVVVAGLALVLLESWIRRGHPLATGYVDDHGLRTALPYSGLPGFSYPIFFGALSLLFSFGKGVLWFAPALVLPLPKGQPEAIRRLRLSLLLSLAGLLLVYSHWWSWYGGWAWGPRFLLFASLPATLVLTLRLEARGRSALADLLTLLALAFSFWVGLSGLIFEQDGLNRCVANGYALEAFCWYVPEMSPLFHPFVEATVSSYDWVCAAVWCAAFLYLAGPLVASCTAAARETGTRLWQRVDWRAWRL